MSAPQAYPNMMPQQPHGQPGAYPGYQAYQPQPSPIVADEEPSLCTQIMIRIAVGFVMGVIIALIKIFLL
jgi:hypothetical protein